MLDLPKHVYIAGFKIAIRPAPADRALDRYGEFLPDRQVMWVRTDLPGELMRSTLLHEILHAVFAYDTIFAGTPERAEEQLVASLESALFALLNDPRNRRVVEFILGG